jgi:hypothetical protein
LAQWQATNLFATNDWAVKKRAQINDKGHGSARRQRSATFKGDAMRAMLDPWLFVITRSSRDHFLV